LLHCPLCLLHHKNSSGEFGVGSWNSRRYSSSHLLVLPGTRYQEVWANLLMLRGYQHYQYISINYFTRPLKNEKACPNLNTPSTTVAVMYALYAAIAGYSSYRVEPCNAPSTPYRRTTSGQYCTCSTSRLSRVQYVLGLLRSLLLLVLGTPEYVQHWNTEYCTVTGSTTNHHSCWSHAPPVSSRVLYPLLNHLHVVGYSLCRRKYLVVLRESTSSTWYYYR
jgi:hypothetical protein